MEGIFLQLVKQEEPVIGHIDFIYIEIFAFEHGQAHGVIWLNNGTAIPFSMPMEAYETALQNGMFIRVGDQEDLYPDANGVLNSTTVFTNTNHVAP